VLALMVHAETLLPKDPPSLKSGRGKLGWGRTNFARPFFDCKGSRASRLLRRRIPHGSQNALKEFCSACTLENPRADAAAARLPNCSVNPEMVSP